MLLLITTLLTLALSVLYVIFGNVPAQFWGVLATLGVAVGIFLALTVLELVFFLVVNVVFEKSNPKSMFKHRLLDLFTHWFYNGILRVRVIVTGKENLPTNNRFVVFCNHIEASDPMYMKQVYKDFPVAFVSKVALFKSFPVKNILSSVGCIPISPKADNSALNSIKESIERVENGQPMGIFPEGKRTYGNTPINFRPGAFKLPLKAQADISPVALYDMHEIYRKGRILPVKVYLHVLPLIKYEDYKDMDTIQIADMVQTMIVAQMEKFAATVRK